MKKRKLYSDRYLMMLWRQAVLISHDGRCVFCGNGNENQLECHHFIKRRNKILRWDWRNGFSLCNGLTDNKCHIKADTQLGRQKLIKIMGDERFEILASQEKILWKDYKLMYNYTDNEFRKVMYDDMKQKINSNKCEWNLR